MDEISSFDEIESIDEDEANLDHSQEPFGNRIRAIPPEIEFWGHCSNMQVWSENDYDTRLIHRNLDFPLLKRLTELGDPIAKKVFKEEVAKRWVSGHPSVVEYLKREGYLGYLTQEELEAIEEDF